MSSNISEQAMWEILRTLTGYMPVRMLIQCQQNYITIRYFRSNCALRLWKNNTNF